MKKIVLLFALIPTISFAQQYSIDWSKISGGGFRSALTCDVAQKMGYKNVFSLAGGYKANWPMKSGG